MPYNTRVFQDWSDDSFVVMYTVTNRDAGMFEFLEKPKTF